MLGGRAALRVASLAASVAVLAALWRSFAPGSEAPASPAGEAASPWRDPAPRVAAPSAGQTAPAQPRVVYSGAPPVAAPPARATTGEPVARAVDASLSGKPGEPSRGVESPRPAVPTSPAPQAFTPPPSMPAQPAPQPAAPSRVAPPAQAELPAQVAPPARDGDRVGAIARPAEPTPAPGLVDLNSASLAELNGLRGGGQIGRAIMRGRPYAAPEDLLAKRVLNRTTYQQIKNQVTVR